jgi:hypothetical protein
MAEIRRRDHVPTSQRRCVTCPDSLMLAFLRTPGYSSRATEASGTFGLGLSLQTPTVNGETAIVPFVFAETMSGTVSGKQVGSGTLVLHLDGSINARHSGTFTGRIAGQAGTATLRIKASGTLNHLKARFVFCEGTGDLEDVQARGTFVGGVVAATKTGDPIITGSYTGRFRLE